MIRRHLALIPALFAAFSICASSASAAASPKYYLALGDSLSQGVQPDPVGASLETNDGYPDQLLAIEQHRLPSLQLVTLGCPGDTTGSLLTGHGNKANARKFKCDRTGGSQLKAAERFLRQHHNKGEVPLITIDIGANDVDGCVTASNLGACVTAGVNSIKHDVPLILKALKKAAPKGTVFAAMTLYDPILSDYFSANAQLVTLASLSIALADQVNADLTRSDKAGGFRTADVAGAFKTDDVAKTVSYNDQLVPVDVATVCSWTWACTPPPSGPNIHANKNGYAVIAETFAKAIGKLK